MDFPAVIPSLVAGALSWYENGPSVYLGGPSSVAMTANAAIYMQCFTPIPLLIPGFGWYNGATVSGNVDCGLYDQNGILLDHTGSTAQAGVNAAQTGVPTGGAFYIRPGSYWVALAIDNGTGTFQAQTSAQTWMMQAVGILGQASAFPLPATAAMAAPTQQRAPYCAAFIETSVF